VRFDAKGVEVNDRGHVRRRLAAWIALTAGAGVLVSLLTLLLRDAVALAEAVAAIALAGAAAWLALTRHGALRGIGIAALVAALAAGVTALVERGAVGALVALGVTLAAFVAASRRALRETTPPGRRTGRVQAGGASGSARRRRLVLLMNPHSGGGKVERYNLIDEAKRRGIDPILLEPGDDLAALAREAARSADVLGMAGGDGSQALVAQVAIEHDLGYVCVPAGTRNHLALDLGLDRGNVIAALDAFTSDVERRVDVAYVNERIFVNNVSLGIYAEIVQSAAYRDAKLQTAADMLPRLLGPGGTPFDLRFRGARGREHRSAQLVLVSNNPYQLDQLAGLGSRPRLDSGLLGIVAVEIRNAAEAAELATLEAIGQVRRFQGWSEWAAEQFEVDSAYPIATGIDGEAVTLEPPLRFRVAPSTLRVQLPPTAAGLSPAALVPAPTGSTLRHLWEVAAGRPGR
jgi:diacylglycerol kinase family enzyme